MSELIPSCNWEDFVKIAEQGRLEELKSSEVIFNGKYLFTAIIPHGDMFAVDYARTQSEYLAMRTNTELGKYPEELLAEIEGEKYSKGYICRECKKLFGSRIALEGHKRSHKTPVLA